MTPDDPHLPPVSAIIATRGRPELLRAAVRSILDQDYPAQIEVIVVFDHIPIDPLADVDVPAGRSLRSIPNVRTQGLAGGRNSGLLQATHELVAFCDDDDEWMPDKLRKQMAAWSDDPEARLIATGMRVQTAGAAHDRLPPPRLEYADFLASRVNSIGSSSFLLRKHDFFGELGLVDEEIPASFGEDYDMLLRITKLGHVLNVVEPLVIINWNRASFFAGRWEATAAALQYLLAKHPDIAGSAVGTARIEGQIAFALAAVGQREEARQWARSAIRNDPSQLRAYAAYGVAARLLPAALLVRMVNRRGRGL